MDDLSVIFICIAVLSVFVGIPTFCICSRNVEPQVQNNPTSYNGKYIQI